MLSAGQAEQAAEQLRAISQDDSGEMQDYVLYRYGYALAKAGKFAESSKVYQELSQKFPKSNYASGSSLAAGQALMRDKKYDEASEYFRRLLPVRDDTASEAAHLLCQIALMQGKAAEAIPIARNALSGLRVALALPL